MERLLVDTELRDTNLDPVFGTAICRECNNKFRKIDVAVTKASYLAETFRALKQELNFGSGLQANHDIDNQLFDAGMRFVHYLVLDPDCPFLCRNMRVKSNRFDFSHIPIPLAPQIIFIWDESAFKAIVEKWSEAEIQDKSEITNIGKYSIGNVVEFCVPKVVNEYLKDKQQLEQKFLKAQKICIMMPLEKAEESEVALFYNSLPDNLKVKTQRKIEDTSNKSELKSGRVLGVPHTKSNLYRLFMRGAVKNAFHSFLYAYSAHSPYNKVLENTYTYRGSESMFDGVKNFILKGIGDTSEFIKKVDTIKNIKFLPNDSKSYHYHYHKINFYITESNIGCIISYFLGLKGVNECYQVLLARNPDFRGSDLSPVNNEIFIPFRVHTHSYFYDSLSVEQPLLHYPRKFINRHLHNLIYNRTCPVADIKITP